MQKITILGSGAAGLSCSYHAGHQNCIIFEKNEYFGGHLYSHQNNGFIWDEGPHVSFTKIPYVQDLFYKSVKGELLEFSSNVSNWFKGSWIPHPAQSNLFAAPEILRKSCLKDFLKAHKKKDKNKIPRNYEEWLLNAFGETFTKTFPKAYTKKYWTVEARELATDWIGNRVYYPKKEDFINGSKMQLNKQTHYIDKFRYPSRGGFKSFVNELRLDSNIKFNHKVSKIDLKNKIIFFNNGKQHSFERLISTLPLPELIKIILNVPPEIKHAADLLLCSSLLLVNITANHKALKPYHWLYVYDDNKLSTRINHIDLLSSGNTPKDKTGVQVEVYFSSKKPLTDDISEIKKKVVQEVKEMGLIIQEESVHTQIVKYANVIFDHNRRSAQNKVLNWLEQFGLEREDDDLEPITNWQKKCRVKSGNLMLAGRYGQWKYYWSDDCVMRGKVLFN